MAEEGALRTWREWGPFVWAEGEHLQHMTGFLWNLGRLRKLRLFSLACLDRVRSYITDPRSLAAIAFYEQCTDESTGTGHPDLPAVAKAAEEASKEVGPRHDYSTGPPGLDYLRMSRSHYAVAQVLAEDELRGALACGQQVKCILQEGWMWANGHWPVDWRSQHAQDTRIKYQRELCAILKEVAGDPFRPAAFAPAWRTDTAVALAQQMYDAREFSAMPILADALQDAGCDNDDILNHCRDGGPHVRGCWVVDLVLGKE